MSTVKSYLSLIKFSHTIFAMPFALIGFFLGISGREFPTGWGIVQTAQWNLNKAVGWGMPGIRDGVNLSWEQIILKFILVILCMVFARSAAMAFNRLADASIDAANPRTQSRALPVGALSKEFVAVFVVASCAVFVLAAWQLNRLTMLLSPVALAVVLLYSYTKRVTRWSHLVLGFSLGIAPAAAWIAVRGSLDPHILLLTAAVMFWVAGFDILYACQDYEFDRQTGLHSIPRHWGISRALWLARMFHITMLIILVALLSAFGLGKVADVGLGAVTALLIYEHSLVSSKDLSKLNAAFFTMNGVISVVFFAFVAGDLLTKH